jgi:hypothetical protein
MARTLTLTDGREALVDDDVYEWASQLNWRPLGKSDPYAVCDMSNGATVLLHRAVMGAPDGVLVDHINRTRLDCRRENLRIVTRSQNAQNTDKPFRPSHSHIRGVSYDRTKGLYRAVIWANGKRIQSGKTKSLEQAAEWAAELRRTHHTHAPLARKGVA